MGKGEFEIYGNGLTPEQFAQLAEKMIEARKGAPKTCPTALRPTGVAPGTMVYDEGLKRPIWWSGTEWRLASGAVV